MNRHQRRADAARARKPDRAEAIRIAVDYLANAAAPTVTGATLMFPDGSTLFLSADDARALHGDVPKESPQ
jgi:hypothetical protein